MTEKTRSEKRVSASLMQPEPGTGGAQSIHRALHIVRVLSAAPAQGMKLVSIAEASGLSYPTTYRILQALESEGIVERSPDSRRYVIGAEMVWLGLRAAQRFPIVELATPFLDRIVRDIGDTVIMSVRSGNYSVCVERLNGRLPTHVTAATVGARLPIRETPAGLVMLAYLPDRLADRILSACQQEEGERLSQKIGSVRLRGHLVSGGITVRNTRAVTVPVRDAGGNAVAAISVIGTQERLRDARLDHVVSALNAASEETSRAIWQNAAHRSIGR